MLPIDLLVCVCVCVCVRERERERDFSIFWIYYSEYSPHVF
jgi:hypothetical protein